MFAEKLNFLISIIGISGGELAKAISLDPSYISRLRHGKRALPKGNLFMEPIALYFAMQIKNDYQKKLISEAMGMKHDWPDAIEKAQGYLLDWLVSDNPRQRDIMKDVFQQMSDSFPVEAPIFIEDLPDLSEYRDDTRKIYFGKKGKQEAYFRFLTLATDAIVGDGMRMFSNEDLWWKDETPDIQLKILSLLRVYAKNGNEIKIIHALSEDTESMLTSLQGWIPTYLTGYVKPYYYPEIREDFYKRTAFVVPGVVAMTSTSLDGNPADDMTFILTESKAVKAVEEELSYLESQSIPLAKVFSAKDVEGFHTFAKDFLNAKGDTILVHENISPFILPESMRRIKEVRDSLHFKSIERLAKTYDYTTIIHVPDFDRICRGEVPVQFSSIIAEKQVFFNKKEYLENLYCVIDLLSTKGNYNLFFKNHALKNMLLCVKKDVGILFMKHKESAMAFYVDQPNIVEAVWQFLKSSNEEATPKNQKEALQTLKELAKKLEATL